MRKTEIKKATIGELIIDLVQTYSIAALNQNAGMPTKRANQHLTDLETELIARGILTNQQVETLNK